MRIMLEPKVQMKKRGLDSPDDADDLALTFAVWQQTDRNTQPSATTAR